MGTTTAIANNHINVKRKKRFALLSQKFFQASALYKPRKLLKAIKPSANQSTIVTVKLIGKTSEIIIRILHCLEYSYISNINN